MFRGGDLVADALADDLTLELRKDNRTLRVRRPIEVVVLNCWVTETNDVLLVSRISTILAKSASDRVSLSIL